MSNETIEHLNTRVLVGCVEQRGKAWHYSAAAQGDESNHYPGFIPVEDVRRRLFNWEIVKVPLTVTVPVTDFDVATGLDENGQMVRTYVIDDRVATVRSDSGAHLGITSSSYEPHQYGPWLIDELGSILDVAAGDLGVGSAGELKRGAYAWVQIEVPDGITIGGDTVRPFILAATSADGSMATTYRSCVQRVVCDNTLDCAMAERGNAVFKVRHTAGSADRLGEARRALDIAYEKQDRFVRQMDMLMNVAVSDAQWAQIVDRLAPVPDDETRKAAITRQENLHAALNTMYRSDERVAPWSGTAWGALQAFNTHRQHASQIRKATDRGERNKLRVMWGDELAADRKVLQAIGSVTGQAGALLNA
jgi:phage/plasmid-like protein (TIGR03299 family)